LRQEQLNSSQATRRLEKLSVAQKNELLFQHGINFNDLPNWQKRGIGAYWKTYSKEGLNPVLGQSARVERSALYIDLDLPMRENYSQMLRDFLGAQWSERG
jgi:tRNA(His) 5'-end guanylyltransferase